jgi:prolyl-tRNA synthetase
MKFSRLFTFTTKENPKDAVLPSHKYLLKAGFIKQIGSGIYDFLPLGKMVFDNIKNVVKTELDNAGCNEVVAGFVTPCELWAESSRIDKMGDEMLRLKDRKGQCFVLSPTNEESFVDIVRSSVKSYKQLPLNLYQINTKFRDEARPRFGLLRGREFVMKDGYSFHCTTKDLDREFDLMQETYKKIFTKLGLDFRIVMADSGAIGGNGSKEFMVLADSGEDTLAVCESCEYSANIEIATKKNPKKDNPIKTEEIEQIKTPNIKSIDEVASFLQVDKYFIVKAVIKKAIFEDKSQIVVFFVRGDDELEETKAKNAIFANELVEASVEEIKESGLVAGYVGPFGLASDILYIIDDDLRGAEELVCGANVEGYHIKGASLKEANILGNVTRYGDISAVKQGDCCPKCGGTLTLTKGIEVGHIFKLGTTYTEPMKATFLDENGKPKPFIMGCYGIGVSRLVAASIEQNHDEFGMIWPQEIAPFVVDIIIGDIKKSEQVEFATNLYNTLKEKGVNVLLDDRAERFGPKIKDFELIGFPYAIVIGKKLKDEVVEIRKRDGLDKIEVSSSKVLDKILEMLK